ncbi:hypothetical protein V8E54_013745 [Elaphomyces granulatus]
MDSQQEKSPNDEAFKILRERHADMIAKSFLEACPLTDLLSIKGFPHGEPEIGDYSQTDAEIEAYQHAHVKIPEIGGEWRIRTRRRHPLATVWNPQLRATTSSPTSTRDPWDWQERPDDQGLNGYTHRDGSQVIPQRQGEMSSTWQVSNYRHEQVDMRAWDEDSDEDEGTQWPSEEQDIDHEEEAYMDDAYWR